MKKTRAIVARDLRLLERAAGRSDPRPGATPGAAGGTEEGGRSCPLCGLPATHERQNKDPGRPYEFNDAETLIDDFFDEVEQVLRDRGIGLRVTRTEASPRSK